VTRGSVAGNRTALALRLRQCVIKLLQAGHVRGRSHRHAGSLLCFDAAVINMNVNLP
jgi:hypothetical protein